MKKKNENIDETVELNVDNVKKGKKKGHKALKFFMPLIIIILVLIIAVILLLAFRNVIASKALTSTMQNTFGARADVEKVDIQLIKSRVEVVNIEQADKDDYMKNLFQIDKVIFDYDLGALFKGSFHSEIMAVEGVALGTERTVSGEPTKKIKKSRQQKKGEASLATKAENLSQKAYQALVEMFANYNPETMMANMEKELKSPAVANKISVEVQKKIDEWQKVSSDYETSINKFSESVNTLSATDWNNISDPVQLKKALTAIGTAMTEGNNLKNQLQKTTSSLSSDVKKVDSYSKELNAAIKADNELVNVKINDMKKMFTVSGLNSMMNDAVEAVMYSVCGKYYPYALKAKNTIASSVKTSAKAEKKEAKKVKSAKSGKKSRNSDMPKIWVEKLYASGYENGTDKLLFSANGLNLSDNQNLTGKPSILNAEFKNGATSNTADLTFDVRPVAKNILSANYRGFDYPMACESSVLNLVSKSNIYADAIYSENGELVIKGTLDLNDALLTGCEFEPECVASLYGRALSEIKKLRVAFTVTFDKKGNMLCSIDNLEDITTLLVKPVSAALAGELNEIASEASKNMTKVLGDKTGDASSKLNQFGLLNGTLNAQNSQVSDMNKQLEQMKSQISRQLAGNAFRMF